MPILFFTTNQSNDWPEWTSGPNSAVKCPRPSCRLPPEVNLKCQIGMHFSKSVFPISKHALKETFLVWNKSKTPILSTCYLSWKVNSDDTLNSKIHYVIGKQTQYSKWKRKIRIRERIEINEKRDRFLKSQNQSCDAHDFYLNWFSTKSGIREGWLIWFDLIFRNLWFKLWVG